MVLSQIDKQILESYKRLLDGLSDYLGEGYEIVLHSLEDLDHSVIKIINGHYSGRSIGAPITDLALSMLNEIKNNNPDHMYKTYFNKRVHAECVKGSTIPIFGEDNRIIGLLCMNFYLDIPLYDYLKGFSENNGDDKQRSEIFANKIDDLIVQKIEEARQRVFGDPEIASTHHNRHIIIYLFENGIFKLKDSVAIVAKELRVTKNTVYTHIRNLE